MTYVTKSQQIEQLLAERDHWKKRAEEAELIVAAAEATPFYEINRALEADLRTAEVFYNQIQAACKRARLTLARLEDG